MASSQLMKEIDDKKREVEKELRLMEDHIYELETNYLANSQNFGNIIKGYDQLLTQKSGQVQMLTTGRKAPGAKSFKESERAFTLSSATNRQQIIREEEEETRVNVPISYSSGSKRKAKLSKGEPKLKKRGKGKKSDDDTDFSGGTRD